MTGKPQEGNSDRYRTDLDVPDNTKKIGRCFEVKDSEPIDTPFIKTNDGFVVHYYIEIVDNTSITLETVTESGEPSSQLIEGIPLSEFSKTYLTCSQHDCPLQPRTVDEISVKMSDNRAKLGEELLEAGKVEEAEEKFKRALAFNEENVKASLGVGKVQLEQGKIDEAMETFHKISGENEIYEDANKHTLNQFAIYLRKKELYPLAIENYEKAISIDPDDEALYFNLARALKEEVANEKWKERKLEKIQKAIGVLRESLKIRCDFKEGKFYLNKLLEEEKEILSELFAVKEESED